MAIPDFLKPENVKPNPEAEAMLNLCRKYNEVFGTFPMTEPSSYTTREWIEILEECIEKRKNIWEITGEEYDPEADY